MFLWTASEMASSSSNPSSSDSRTIEDIFKDYKARPASEMASSSSDPRTVKDIFKNYKARRRGLIQALTLGTCSMLFCLSPLQFDCREFEGKWKKRKCLKRFYEKVLEMNFLIFFEQIFLISSWFGAFVLFSDADAFYRQCDPGQLVLLVTRI